MGYRKYYYRQPEPGESFASFLAGALCGLVIGGVLGLLLAPHRGDISRRKIVRRAGEARDQVVETVEDHLEQMKERKADNHADEKTNN